MVKACSSAPIVVPYGADQTLYVVVDRAGGARDVRVERPELETIIGELMAGCFSDPIAVYAFNTLEHWAQNISALVAREIQTRCDMACTGVPDHLLDFVQLAHTPAQTLSTPLPHAGLGAR